jgi:glycosyltransferase involved in cell wall biosynthesis
MDLEKDNGLAVGFFGTFFPEGAFAGNSSTGIVAALLLNRTIKSVDVFSQIGAIVPKSLNSSKIHLAPCWAHDRPLSILRTVPKLLKQSHRLDGFLWNTYVTAFGRTAPSNVVGLLVPTLISVLTRKPVVVYMHNFLETQDAEQLGYRPTIWQRIGVRFLERLLLRHTKVVVPLRSQQETVVKSFRIGLQSVFLPYIEPLGLSATSEVAHNFAPVSSGDPTRILLLGSWGPQKDLSGVVRALRVAHERGAHFVVTITGAVNVHFPHYAGVVKMAVGSLDPKWVRFMGQVPEADLLDVVTNQDLLILPYNATGGYSGAMNLGDYCGVGVLAYDLPQLREAAEQLGSNPTFVKKEERDAFASEILNFCANVSRFRETRTLPPRPESNTRACRSVDRLIEIMRSVDTS